MFVIIRRQWGYCYSMEVGRDVFCTQVIDEKSFGMPYPVFMVNGQGCCQSLHCTRLPSTTKNYPVQDIKRIKAGKLSSVSLNIYMLICVYF